MFKLFPSYTSIQQQQHKMAATVFEAQQALTNQSHIFLQPTTTLHTAFLQLAKRYLDPLASNVTEAQLQRQKLQRQAKKRKRGTNDDDDTRVELLRMKKVHVDGFEVDQVWQQARRVLDAATDELEREIPEEEDEDEDEDGLENGRVKNVHFDDEGLEVGESDDEVLGEGGVDYEVEGAEDGDDYEDDDQVEGEDHGGYDEDMDGTPSVEEESLDMDSDVETPGQAQETYVKDPNNLNDGFFSIDDFNKQSQFLEQQDFRGEDDGAASDEEDIDWGTDPFAMGAQRTNSTSKSKSKAKAIATVDEDEEDDDDDDDNDGPTFGNMALNAPEGDSDIEDLDMNDADSLNSDDMGAGDTGNANNIMYTDFFAPPARSASKKPRKNKTHESRRKPAIKLATEDSTNDDAEAAAIQRTMSAVQRDLFNEEDVSEDDLEEEEEVDPDEYDILAAEALKSDTRPARQNLSTHEKRQLALRSEIRRLEAVAVASKPWYLSGESLAASRPENALLEEDLEFERAGKPVPVITEETNEDILALIKRRILSRDFDEIPRRRPGEADLAPRAKRGKVEEVSTTRASKGLAEEYEDDLLRRTDPNYVDERSEAVKAQHAEIEGLWKHVSAQLDTLSNWHYKPRPAGASLEVRSDVASVALEDARPSLAVGGDVGARVLAPQEVFKPGGDGDDGDDKEVVRTNGGQAVSREEMSREQKVRRRRREKERQRKAGANEVEAVKSNVIGDVDGKSSKKGRGNKRDRREVEAQLKKSGARVIDSKGTIRDVEGNVSKESVIVKGGVGSLRL